MIQLVLLPHSHMEACRSQLLMQLSHYYRTQRRKCGSIEVLAYIALHPGNPPLWNALRWKGNDNPVTKMFQSVKSTLDRHLC